MLRALNSPPRIQPLAPGIQGLTCCILPPPAGQGPSLPVAGCAPWPRPPAFCVLLKTIGPWIRSVSYRLPADSLQAAARPVAGRARESDSRIHSTGGAPGIGYSINGGHRDLIRSKHFPLPPCAPRTISNTEIVIVGMSMLSASCYCKTRSATCSSSAGDNMSES